MTQNCPQERIDSFFSFSFLSWFTKLFFVCIQFSPSASVSTGLMFTGNATCCGIFAMASCKSSSLWSIRHGATPDDRCSWKDIRKDGTGGRGGTGWKKSNLCEYVKIMTKKLWCYDDVVPQQISKRICPVARPKISMHVHWILIFFLGFQIPPIFCISS